MRWGLVGIDLQKKRSQHGGHLRGGGLVGARHRNLKDEPLVYHAVVAHQQHMDPLHCSLPEPRADAGDHVGDVVMQPRVPGNKHWGAVLAPLLKHLGWVHTALVQDQGDGGLQEILDRVTDIHAGRANTTHDTTKAKSGEKLIPKKTKIFALICLLTRN